MSRHGMIIAAMALLLCGFSGKLTQEHQPVIDYLNGHSKLPVVASTGPLPSPAPTIVVGGDRDNPPYEFFRDGRPTGFNIELIQAAGRAMHLNLEVRLGPWGEMRSALEAGKINALAGMYYSETRARTVDFSVPHTMVTPALFVRRDSPIKTFEAARNKEIIVQQGDVIHDLLRSQGFTSRIAAKIDPSEVMLLLASGKHDCALVPSELQGFYFIERYHLNNLKALHADIPALKYCFAVRKGDAKLLAKLNEGLNILKATGEYRQIYDKWFGVYEPRFTPSMRIIVAALGTIGVLLLLSLAWSWSLRRQVRTRTEELQAGKNKYSSLIRKVQTAIVLHDGQGCILACNTLAQRLLGFSEAHLVGKALLDPNWNFLREDGSVMPIPEYPASRVLASRQPIRNYVVGISRPNREHITWVLVNADPEYDQAGELIQIIVSFVDITERKRMEREHLQNLRYFESMDKVNRAIQAANDIEQMMSDVLDTVLSIFDCDRAFLLYPLDPDAGSWTIPMIRTRPEYPAPYSKGPVPMDPLASKVMRAMLDSDDPVKAGPETAFPLTKEISERFDFKSFMARALYPKVDTPWEFAIHQCSYARVWDHEEERLFKEIGRRLSDALTGLLSHRNLLESEEKYRLIVETTREGIWMLGPDLTTTFVNTHIADMTGYSAEELIGRPFTDVMFAEDVPDHHRRMELRKQGVSENYERRMRHKDGKEIWIHISATPVFDDEHHFRGTLAMFTDITARKRAEDALRRSEEEKTILNQIANVFLTISDEAIYGKILAVVRQVMKSKLGLFGYIGENGDLVIPSLTREIWNECQVPGKSIVFSSDSWGNSLWGRAIREKKAFYSDGPFRTPEGHIHIDHFLTVPIVYGQETIGLISVANKEGGYAEEDKDLLELIASKVSPILYARSQRDAQERRRKLAEEDLRESEEKYRLLITNADEAIFIVQDEVVKFPNPKALEMSGYSMEELAGIPFIDLVHPGDKDTVFKTYLRVLEREQPSEAYPFRIVNKIRKEMWVQLTTAPIIWEKKQGILCFLRDITQEKKLESQFMQAQKMEAVGRLAGGVAHDFNNMLGVIMGYTELALEKVDPDQPIFVDLQEVRKAAGRSVDLTRQLLAFARKQTVAPKVLDLNETVEGMLKILRRLIGEDINLAWLPGTGVWPVKVDPSQIDQILANLCVNARDAIAEVGKVTIETQPVAFDEAYCADHPGSTPGEYVLLTVSDSGCGMDKGTLDKLFEPFFTTKEIGKGTGLGLATVYGIVKQNNGFINVYSEPGKGSTFKIYIPRFEGQAAPRQMQARSEPARGAGETVLLVEDDLLFLKLSQNILERLGYKVLPASTPVEAIQLAEEHAGKIDLLITDMVMPEMNGRDLAERLLSTNPKLKQLFMSGYTSNAIAHQGLLDEGVHFIQKPFSIQNLAAKVREVLIAQDERIKQ